MVQKLNSHEDSLRTKDYSTDFLPQLDFIGEAKKIKGIMKATEFSLAFKSSVATPGRLTEMLKESPRILHISCHGLNLTVKAGPTYDRDKAEKTNCLLFEKENGEGHLMDSLRLNALIRQALPDLDVIFLAACNSEFAGRIFLKCGAKHVICIKKDNEVLDKAAIDFTDKFYSHVISGDSVCQAFDKAKAAVEFLH